MLIFHGHHPSFHFFLSLNLIIKYSYCIFIEQIYTNSFLIKLKGIEVQKLLQKDSQAFLFLQSALQSKGNNHDDHRIRVESTYIYRI
jgi:hypothetical protein